MYTLLVFFWVGLQGVGVTSQQLSGYQTQAACEDAASAFKASVGKGGTGFAVVSVPASAR
jgi:hypothetical protein